MSLSKLLDTLYAGDPRIIVLWHGWKGTGMLQNLELQFARVRELTEKPFRVNIHLDLTYSGDKPQEGMGLYFSMPPFRKH